MSNLIKTGASLIFIIFAIGLFAGLHNLGNTVNHDQNSSNNVAPLWSSVSIGMTEGQVKNLLGTPDNTSTSTSSNYSGGTDTMDSWTYGTLGTTTYSLDFTNNVLSDKFKM